MLPVRRYHLVEPSSREDPCIGDQYVDAPELVDGVLDDGLGLLGEQHSGRFSDFSSCSRYDRYLVIEIEQCVRSYDGSRYNRAGRVVDPGGATARYCCIPEKAARSGGAFRRNEHHVSVRTSDDVLGDAPEHQPAEPTAAA